MFKRLGTYERGKYKVTEAGEKLMVRWSRYESRQ